MSYCVKSYGNLCQIYQNHSLNMVMSREPGFKFRKFLFFAQFYNKFQEKLLNLGEIHPRTEKLQEKKQTGESKVKLEGYLTNIKNNLHREAFCQFRISAHPLMCETGRYCCNIAYEQRLCRLCEMNKVESEHHFIFECSYYGDLRN